MRHRNTKRLFILAVMLILAVIIAFCIFTHLPAMKGGFKMMILFGTIIVLYFIATVIYSKFFR